MQSPPHLHFQGITQLVANQANRDITCSACLSTIIMNHSHFWRNKLGTDAEVSMDVYTMYCRQIGIYALQYHHWVIYAPYKSWISKVLKYVPNFKQSSIDASGTTHMLSHLLKCFATAGFSAVDGNIKFCLSKQWNITGLISKEII